MPWTINNYKLDELTTQKELRNNLSFLFKQNAHIRNPKVVDILIYKGREELEVSFVLFQAMCYKDPPKLAAGAFPRRIWDPI